MISGLVAKASEMDVALRVEHVSVTYASKRGDVPALEDLSIEAERGSFLCVVGPSGCGKSTLLRLLSGLLRPTSGAAYLHGEQITGARRDVGIVFQQPTLLPWQTALQNVLLPVRTLGLDRQEGARRAEELLKLVGLESFQDRYPFELSGGMQQRVAIARGLVHEPNLLLMDEPFASLDAMTREHMMVELQRIWSETKKSVVFITHSIPEAVFLGDRVIVLSPRPGRIVRSIDVPLSRPRDLRTMGDARFSALCSDIRDLIGVATEEGPRGFH